MECPHCGVSKRGLHKVTSTRISCGIGVTRVRRCGGCGERFFSVEVPIDECHIAPVNKHYHVKDSVFRRLIMSLYK